MPTPNGPFPSTACPYFARFQPSGREHTYDLCEAHGEEPFVPSRAELEELCHGDFPRCPRFQAAKAREAVVEPRGSRGTDRRVA